MEQLDQGDSGLIIKMLLNASLKLKNAGAEFLIIPANSSHLVFDQFARQAPLPVISMVEATLDFCTDKGFNRPLVLGTRWTMEKRLYDNSFYIENGFEVLYPTLEEQKTVHRIIFEDLISGTVSDAAREDLYRIIETNRVRYAPNSVILGCTELPLIFDERSPLPFVDSSIALVLKALRIAAGLLSDY